MSSLEKKAKEERLLIYALLLLASLEIASTGIMLYLKGGFWGETLKSIGEAHLILSGE